MRSENHALFYERQMDRIKMLTQVERLPRKKMSRGYFSIALTDMVLSGFELLISQTKAQLTSSFFRQHDAEHRLMNIIYLICATSNYAGAGKCEVKCEASSYTLTHF